MKKDTENKNNMLEAEKKFQNNLSQFFDSFHIENVYVENKEKSVLSKNDEE